LSKYLVKIKRSKLNMNNRKFVKKILIPLNSAVIASSCSQKTTFVKSRLKAHLKVRMNGLRVGFRSMESWSKRYHGFL